MIIGVSIVDKHAPEGKRHIGTYMFEIDRANDSHLDFFTAAAPPDGEATLRPYLGRLLKLQDIPNPVNANGEPVNENGDPV